MMSIDTNAENRKSYEKVVRIYYAIHLRRGRIEKTDIERLLQTEGDINYRITEASTVLPNLLCIALREIRSLHFDLLGLLLDYGVDFTFKDNNGKTAVHNLIEKRTFNDEQCIDQQINSILTAHVKFNNPSNPSDNNGLSHFHVACMTNNVAVVEFFLKNRVDVNQSVKTDSTSFSSYTPLHFAVKFIHPDIVDVLLNYGANVHLKNTDGLSSIHLTVESAMKKSESAEEIKKISDIWTKFVINHGIDTDEFGFSKFHLACLLSDESLVETALEQVTDISQPIKLNSHVCAGFSALHFATFSNIRIFKLLLENGAQIEAKNAKGQTAFDLCLQNFTIDDIHSIIILKNQWKDIVLSDNQIKLTDCILALEDVNTLTSFLDRSECSVSMFVPFNATLWPGYTLLHLAVMFSKKNDIVAECLKRGADITKTGANESTALHLAFYMKKLDVIDYLLDNHEKSNNPANKDNLSHFHIACAAGNLKAVKHFLSTSININSTVLSKFNYRTNAHYNVSGPREYSIWPGSTALHINIASGHFDVTEHLLKNGADVNAQDANGFTPVHRLLNWANDRGWTRVANLILKAKRLKNLVTNTGLSHLHVACYFHHREAVEKLLKIRADTKAVLVNTTDTRLKDYDEIYCGSYGNYCRRYSYLSDFAGYMPLDFVWHLRKLHGQSDCKTFWAISSGILARCADLFEDKDKAIPILRRLLRKIDSYQCLHAKWQENVTTPILEEEFGVTTLHLACRFVNVRLVEHTINRGANVNAKVNSKSPVWQGFTPLHIAVKRSLNIHVDKNLMDRITKIVRLLMKHGADPLIVDDDNNTPLHEITRLCRNSYVSEFSKIFVLIANIIENINEFEVNPTNDQKLSVFHLACIAQKKVVVEQFLKHKCDPNQAVSDFSDYFSGSTALIILIEYFGGWDIPLSSYGSDNEIFLEIINLLMNSNANVNATDASGETPLIKAVKSNILRTVLIEKLISNGADVRPMNIYGNTAFELLLKQGDVSHVEIEMFIKAGCHWNTFNSVTGLGYMAQIFRYQQRDTIALDNIMENPIFVRILNNSKTVEIDSNGRTAIHNVVSINYTYISADDVRVREHRILKLFFWRTRTTTTYKDYYMDLIEQLSRRGCDIDHEDNEGKTALHLSVVFKNDKAIIPLLKSGADIDIIDKNGKTAFAYCGQAMQEDDVPWDLDDRHTDYNYGHPNYANVVFALHVHKLEFCGQRVSDQNKRLQAETMGILDLVIDRELKCFHEEMEMAKNINIGTTTLSLYEFLTNTDTEMAYVDMTSEERMELDQFFGNIAEYNFSEIAGLLKLKYRRGIERPKLIELAMESLNQLVKFDLPHVCYRIIVKFLKNEDLKQLMKSTTL